MRPIAWLPLAALLAAPAFAQTSDGPAPLPATPGPPAAQDAPDTKLPLAAMRHQQPRRNEVDERERARYGSSEPQTLKRERTEEDELYNEIMRRSAPGAEGQ